MPQTLSVIMPNYNHSEHLPRSLEAILSQSRPASEFIVVDDASTDSSVAVIEEFARQHDNLRLLRNSRNLGFAVSFGRGLDAARGDFVYGAGADDFVLPRFFERAMAMADRYPQAGIALGQVSAVDPSGRSLGTFEMSRLDEPCFLTPERFLRDCLVAEPPGHSLCTATIYNRRGLEELGRWREELGHWADTFSARALGLKHGACYVPEKFASWRISQEGLAVSTNVNPRLRLDVMARAAYLMRSESFRSYFPTDHVDDWEKAYREMVLTEYHRTRARSVRDSLLPPDRFPRLGNAIERLVLRFPPADVRRLRKYEGDVSCYVQAGGSAEDPVLS